MVSREYLRRSAAATGFRVEALEKVVRLGELAGDISRHPLLRDALVLKGGTPLNLCFSEPRRMSVDLDYNYVRHVDRAAMLQDRPLVIKALTDLATRSGYGVQPSADEHAGHTLFLRYRSVEGPPDQIKVDVNFMMRLPLDPHVNLPVWQPGELDRPVVRVVGSIELLVGKLLAFLDRAAARDAWDVANLPGTLVDSLASPDFRPMFLAMSGILIHQPSPASEARIRRLISDELVQQQLLPMLVDPVGVTGTHLIDAAWPVVAPLVQFTELESGYYAALAAGELRTDLLFPAQQAEADRLATHPALLWRVANVRQHLRNQ